ncbi:MAG: alanine racemase [Nitrosomonadales bacterium]|nr:MAG: alanine racemase [Nitrosomonadales bacterium]
MPRPLRASVCLSALRHNLGIARSHAPRARIMAVIKANGYGHGMLRVAKALEAADGFAVLNIAEAIALREAGFTQEILLLEGFFSADELPLLARHGLSTVIHAQWQLDIMLQTPGSAPVQAWLKINSGMNRLGFQPDEAPAALQSLQQIGAQVTLMTHFARADESDGIAEQLTLFNSVTHGLNLPRSLSNSAAVLSYPEAHGDWVRPGIMLYGASPTSGRSASELGLKPVMTLSSELIAVRAIQAGEAVGYGASFRAPGAMRIGTVACGYADGYPRHAPSGTPVLVDGQRSRIIGRVSMDMLTVDLSAVPGAKIGSAVTLWGDGLTVDEVASAAGTISYELLCAVAARVPLLEAI